MTLVYAGDVRIMQLEVGNYGNNCYILVDASTDAAVIVDAPAEPDRIIAAANGFSVKHILITHRHSDHWGALADVASATGAVVAAHPDDASALPVAVGLALRDGDTLRFGSSPLRILHTPGHTEGSCCFVTGGHVFTGDTLFPGGPGHSTDPSALLQSIESITRKLFVLPPETVVYPGHGQATTIGRSRAEYDVFASRSHPPDLHGDVLWQEA
ncbi:MAG: MBL fold metallo-hydrolase [Chloroflexi bacterium]|nr:MBL fold metallo-hydrolase [Chloroflexota bacterium]